MIPGLARNFVFQRRRALCDCFLFITNDIFNNGTFNRKVYNKQNVYYSMFGAKKVSEQVLKAIENSPKGVATLDLLESLQLCDRNTLKTTLSRLNKHKRIIRLKRGVYSVNPIKDAFYCAQKIFNGYIGFTSALYLHNLITELPFTVTIVTTQTSKVKKIGQYEFRAVSLKEKAVGFEKKEGYTVSTKAKTVFDCLYLPQYSIELDRLIKIIKKLNKKEMKEFAYYINNFGDEKMRKMLR